VPGRSRRRIVSLDSPVLGRVEVIRDRAGVKLLVDGALYAERSRRPEATPTPWLLLAAAAFLSTGPPEALRILLLGYGGGTVARLLRAAIPSARITGLEPDAGVRRAARSELGADVTGVRLRAETAEAFLRRTKERFDAILDDVYAPSAGRLARPEAGVAIPALAGRRLARGGVYAVNLISPATLRERRTFATVARAFSHGASIATTEYAHRVVVGSGRAIRPGAVREALDRLLEPRGVPAAARKPGPLGVASVRLLDFRAGL